MFEETTLWGRLEEARKRLESLLDDDSLYQVRESARITYRRHVVPAALEPSRQNVEDALPLFIMYVSNAAEHASAVSGVERRRLARIVYGVLEGFLREKREPPRSPIMRGLSLLEEIDASGEPPADMGAYYSLLFAVLVAVQAHLGPGPVMRVALVPLYGLARSSLALLAPR